MKWLLVVLAVAMVVSFVLLVTTTSNAFDTIEFDQEVYEYTCDGVTTFDISVRYYGPHIVSTWIWFEYGDGLVVDWQNIVPGAAWATEWNEYSVQREFIGPGPGWLCDNRLIVWFHDYNFGADGDGKVLFRVEKIYADECYSGQIAAVVEERENIYGGTYHDIMRIGSVQGYMPAPVRDMTWGNIKGLYR